MSWQGDAGGQKPRVESGRSCSGGPGSLRMGVVFSFSDNGVYRGPVNPCRGALLLRSTGTSGA